MMATRRALPDVVSDMEWREAIINQLVKEKELTRHGDAVSAARRRLPMVRIEKDYLFETPTGKSTLLDLFEGRSQLIVYHFMFAPDLDEGCPGCSWVADAMSHPAHLHARDTSIVMVSRSRLEKLELYKKRMGWELSWYSSFGSDFNIDFGATTPAGEEHGVSVLLRDGTSVYRTYYTGNRGIEQLGSHWTYLDLTPFGRQEAWEDSPEGWPQTPTYEWQRRHDDYEYRSSSASRASCPRLLGAAL